MSLFLPLCLTDHLNISIIFNMTTKEHLLYFFLSNPIRLHYSDRKFFNNLTMIIKDTKQITTGQDKLFNKLVEKYEVQLKKTNLTKDQMVALPWKANVIETSKEYTSARISLIGDELVARVPMNNKFINKFNDLKDNTFVWNKTKKAYFAPMSTHALKIAYTIFPKYFPEVKYCNKLTAIMDQVSNYSDLIWIPTLVTINNHYYVIATNEVVGNLIASITLDSDPKTLFALSKLGVKIDSNIVGSCFEKFASEFMTEVDVSQISDLVFWLKELEVKQVLLGRGIHNAFNKTKHLFTPMLSTFSRNGIECIPVDSNFEITDNIKLPVLLQYHGNENMKFCGAGALAKCVFIKNSTPIEVK